MLHFLNVCEGDCTVIQHGSGRVSAVDVSNASLPRSRIAMALSAGSVGLAPQPRAVIGNFNQKANPANPIEYLRARGISQIFRFVVTHPHMDHLDGIRDFFTAFRPRYVWDTDNRAVTKFGMGSTQYDAADWAFYTSIRDGHRRDATRLVLYPEATGPAWYDDPGRVADGLTVLAPTPALMERTNRCGEYNDASYVLLFRTQGFKILLAADSHDRTWDYILKNHRTEVANVDLLLAPHHGRASGRSYKFLKVVHPQMTFFGNAECEHLAYDAWSDRGLEKILNNQAGSMVVLPSGNHLHLYVTNEAFAKKRHALATYNNKFQGWYCGTIATKRPFWM